MWVGVGAPRPHLMVRVRGCAGSWSHLQPPPAGEDSQQEAGHGGNHAGWGREGECKGIRIMQETVGF